MELDHGSLYSGIGGWLLSAQWAGINNVFTCEIDKFCNKVIDKNFPEIPKENRHHDIKETDFTQYARRIDILSTSDPCQPFSFAGKRGGTTDDRFLWPETIRVIREVKPPFVVFENVPGFISMAFETVASDLEAEGYTVESFIIPACSVGAWHRRDRLWIIAYSNEQYDDLPGLRTGEISQFQKAGIFKDNGSDTISDPKGSTYRGESGGSIENREKQDKCEGGKIRSNPSDVCKDVSNTNRKRSQRYGQSGERRGECSIGESSKTTNKGRQPESRLGGMADRLPSWMDYFGTEPDIPRVAKGVKNRVNRLKSLGNSIVPQIAYIIFEAIKEVNSN
ncbi:MAG TPA: DNA cytosine methyltransferase [Desulfobacterales bacterium]|nr:DNA cytosine methyltransferase [Desulfobacterales bacterium]